jgi:P-type Ca2+ transporter type 2C
MIGGLTALVTLGAFALEHYNGASLDQARNAAFTVLVFSELFRSFGARSEVHPIWQLGLFTNLRLLAVVLVSFIVQLLIHHVPAMQAMFGIAPISIGQCLAWIALGTIPLILLETRKLLRNPRETATRTPVPRAEGRQ